MTLLNFKNTALKTVTKLFNSLKHYATKLPLLGLKRSIKLEVGKRQQSCVLGNTTSLCKNHNVIIQCSNASKNNSPCIPNSGNVCVPLEASNHSKALSPREQRWCTVAVWCCECPTTSEWSHRSQKEAGIGQWDSSAQSQPNHGARKECSSS